MALIVGWCLATVPYERYLAVSEKQFGCAQGGALAVGERKIALAREIANLTPQEREILAYLVTRNEQVFMGTHHPQKAGTRLTKGLFKPAPVQGVSDDFLGYPYRVPDEV